MKKLFTILSLLLATSCLASAELTKLADVNDLMNGTGGWLEAKGVAKDLTMTGTVYTFTGGCIRAIGGTETDATTAITTKLNSKTGYLTIAAWVNPTSTSEEAIFSYGGQDNGFKFGLKDGKLQLTTKSVKDWNVETAVVSINSWTLVAVSYALDGSSQSSFFVGTNDAVTASCGNYNAASPTTFGIGTGNSNGNRDPFDGSIANLTLFWSESAATSAEINSLMGSAPTLKAIPEPATATLSLLALAGLAARRRRK